MDIITKHEFQAFAGCPACLKCFRIKTDPIHDLSIHVHTNNSDGEGLPLDMLNAISPIGKLESENIDMSGYDIFKPFSDQDIDPGPLPTENDLITEVVHKTEEPDSQPVQSTDNCQGHECPECHKDWFHDYACKKDKKIQALCAACAQQDAVIVNRPVEIEQIAQLSGPNLPGNERAEIINEHTSTVYLMIHDQDNKLVEDWQEKLHNHIRQLEQMIERLRVKALNTRKIITDESAKELVKLTPEERAQYLRDAAKPKKDKEPKEKAQAKPVDAQKEYQKLMKSLLGEVKRRKPNALDTEAQALAEKLYKIRYNAEITGDSN